MSTTCGCGGGHVLVASVTDHGRGLERTGAARARRRPEGHLREVRTVRLQRELLARNNETARRTRRLLAEMGVTMLNLIGAPGSGKTGLLEATIHNLHVRGRRSLIVLEGDQSSDVDTKRIEAAGCRAVRIDTGAGCHLDASMIAEALSGLSLTAGTTLFVENVGNLVCPALYDLGEAAKVVVMPVTQGEDAPLKYNHAFRAADLFVLTKTDLLPHVTFDTERCLANVRRVSPRLEYVPASTVSPGGVDAWCAWVKARA